MQKLLTTKEAAEFLRLKPQTLKVKRMREEPPKYLKTTESAKRSRILYRIEDLEAYMGINKESDGKEG